MEYLDMAMLGGGLAALLIGMVALGWGAATPSRRRAKRVSLLSLGGISIIAAAVLLHCVGGIALIACVLAVIVSVLTVLSGAGVMIWYFVGLIASVDEALTPREPPPPTDFTFLHEQQSNRISPKPKRRSMAERMGLKTAGERIAKMGWMFRKPPS